MPVKGDLYAGFFEQLDERTVPPGVRFGELVAVMSAAKHLTRRAEIQQFPSGAFSGQSQKKFNKRCASNSALTMSEMMDRINKRLRAKIQSRGYGDHSQEICAWRASSFGALRQFQSRNRGDNVSTGMALPISGEPCVA
jgi:hypothetical protein